MFTCLLASVFCVNVNEIVYQELLQSADTNKDAVINFGEFVQYMQQHEHKLRVAFSSLDRNQDGEISNELIMFSFSLTCLTVLSV